MLEQPTCEVVMYTVTEFVTVTHMGRSHAHDIWASVAVVFQDCHACTSLEVVNRL